MLYVMEIWIFILFSKSIVIANTKLTPVETIEINTSIVKNQYNLLSYEVNLAYDEFNIKEYIFTNHRPSESNGLTVISKLHAIYFITKCEFAHWTMFKIYEFIKLCPLFYRNDFQHDDLYDSELKNTFERNLKSFLANTNLFDSLLKALHAYSRYKSNISQYEYAAGTVKTLLSLLIKSHYISSSIRDESKSFISDSNIIRLILIDMIDIQRFLLMNCPEIPISSNNSQLYGIWVDENVTDEKIGRLLNVAKITMKNDVSSVCDCKAEQLLSVITLDLNDDFVKEIATAEIKITHDTSIAVKEILKKMKTNYDVHVLSWYHELILNAIMLQIVKLGEKISGYSMIHTKNIVHKMSKTIFKIQSKFQPQFVPSYIVEGFEVLTKWLVTINTNKDELIQEQKDRFDSYLNNTNITIGKLDPLLGISELGDRFLRLLQWISNNISNLKCFYFLLKPVKESYDKYYAPLANHMRFLLPTDNDKELFGECEFVKSIYSLCYEAFIFRNKYVDSFSNEENKIFFSTMKNVILDVKMFFFLIVKKGTNNVDLLKIAYDVFTVLMNFSLDFKRDLLDIELKRVLNIIMNEMNSYAIKHCASNSSDFFIFNNINFYDFGNGESTMTSIRNFLENNMNNFKLNDFELADDGIYMKNYQFLHVKYIIKQFFSSSYNACSEKIMLYWNGSLQTIKSIIEYESRVIICIPAYVHELYKVYFKFSAASIFIWIKEILAHIKDLDGVKASFKVITDSLGPQSCWLSFFPLKIKLILTSIDGWIFNLEDSWIRRKKIYSEQNLMDRFQDNIKVIEKKFEEVDIYFINVPQKSKKRNLFFRPFCCTRLEEVDSLKIPLNAIGIKYMSDDEFRKIVRDLLSNVKIVSENYLKLTRDPSNASYQNDFNLCQQLDVFANDKSFESENDDTVDETTL